MNIKKIRKFMIKKLSNDKTGHDIKHIERVENNATKIIKDYDLSQSDTEIIIASILLHDIIDYKITDDIQKSTDEVIEILHKSDASNSQIDEILYIINNMSYSKNIEFKKELSLLGQIVQDADRLDAIGAIGIARTFYYGGCKSHTMYDLDNKSNKDLTEEEYKKTSNAISHFHDKLLKLKDLMNTDAAKKEAELRHKFMLEFLDAFKREITK